MSFNEITKLGSQEISSGFVHQNLVRPLANIIVLELSLIRLVKEVFSPENPVLRPFNARCHVETVSRVASG